MAKKSFEKEFKTFIEKCLEEGKNRLDLNFWRINIEYVYELDSYKSNENVTFEIEIDHMYMEATMSVSILAQEKWQEGRLEYVSRDVLHELVHIITEPLAEYAKNQMPKGTHEQLLFLEENLTQRVAMLL